MPSLIQSDFQNFTQFFYVGQNKIWVSLSLLSLLSLSNIYVFQELGECFPQYYIPFSTGYFKVYMVSPVLWMPLHKGKISLMFLAWSHVERFLSQPVPSCRTPVCSNLFAGLAGTQHCWLLMSSFTQLSRLQYCIKLVEKPLQHHVLYNVKLDKVFIKKKKDFTNSAWDPLIFGLGLTAELNISENN